ncbi:helix-turn-helix domain-containing protein [Blastococcus colisei]|uniref:helix-turn-helix domain-containing protein n=1 Tax=Blastococcus colisei TaxID=1564162 RepID=UPI001476D708|nr:helix-turn-helix transcriptional regulator [Blastococcus colisei]
MTLDRLLRILSGDDDPVAAPSVHVLGDSGPMLTHRELHVLRALVDGDSSRGIAERLGISAKTVENHKARIYAKLGVQSQAQAAAMAVRRGLIQADRRGA